MCCVQVDFSTAFDRVNLRGFFYKLCSVGIGGTALSILTQFLSNRSQHVMVDSCRSKLVKVMSGVPHCSVLGSLLFLLFPSLFLTILMNKLISYADDSTLIYVIRSTGIRISVAESPSRVTSSRFVSGMTFVG